MKERKAVTYHGIRQKREEAREEITDELKRETQTKVSMDEG